MTEKSWLTTYRKCDIAAEINPDAYPSVVHMLERAMTVHAEKAAFRSFGQTLTYAEVDRQSRNFASYLQTKLDVRG
jgi:long-chain acyl-CoA synthetase